VSFADDFDWFDNTNVVVRQQDAVAVYANAVGDIVIRQKGDGFDDDVWIIVAPSNASAVATAILEEVWLVRAAEPPEVKADHTAAARQRRYRQRLARNDHRDGVTAPTVTGDRAERDTLLLPLGGGDANDDAPAR
jgi:hypothetical protein